MLYKLKIAKTIPVTVQWIVELWLIYFTVFTSFRVLTLFLFRPSGISLSSIIPSFLLGFQYDVKWIAVILLPIALLSLYYKFSPFYSAINKRLWTYYLAVFTFLLLLFYIHQMQDTIFHRQI